MAAPPAPDAPATIPPATLRTMIRVYIALLTLLYTAFGINFLALPLSVVQYGGVYVNKWLWGPLFLLAALTLSHALADQRLGRLFTAALLSAIAVSGMWLFAATATTLIGQINYVSPFVWLLILGSNVLVYLAHSFANPHAALAPPARLRTVWQRVMQWVTRRKG